MSYEVHDIYVPYLVRFVWNSGEAQREWEFRVNIARNYLMREFPKLIVNSGLAEFAPTLEEEGNTKIGEFVVANVYKSRWNSMSKHIEMMHPTVASCYAHGEAPSHVQHLHGRWDVLRDLYQIALAPDCCREAYFNTTMKDPYHELYGEGETVKRFEDASMNSLLAPSGLFISPIVACSPNCKHAKEKSLQIEKLLENSNPMVHETLRMIMEMPIKFDSYRGITIIDTPMFKTTIATDALKEKKVLKFKSDNNRLFSYDKEWVSEGSGFPFKGPFSGLY